MAPYNKQSKRLGTEGSHIPQHCPMLVERMSALYSYGPILLWPYLVMATEVPTIHNIAPIAILERMPCRKRPAAGPRPCHHGIFKSPVNRLVKHTYTLRFLGSPELACRCLPNTRPRQAKLARRKAVKAVQLAAQKKPLPRVKQPKGAKALSKGRRRRSRGGAHAEWHATHAITI